MKDKMLRYRVCELHMAMVKAGKLEVARNILKCLRKGWVKLYLDDTDWETQELLEKVGCKVAFAHNGYTATAYLHS